jgi:hypothetical protein
MKKAMRAASAMLCLALLCLLPACKSIEDDLNVMVQGNLDALYLAKFDPDYIKVVRTTESACEQDYLDGLDVEAEVFSIYYGLEYLDGALRQEVIDLYKDIYAHARYTVSPVVRADKDTYTAEVTVAPIDIFQRVEDNWEAGLAGIYEKYAGVDFTQATEAEYAAFEADVVRALLAMFRQQLPNLGYRDEETLTLEIKKDEAGLWCFTEKSLYAFDERVIYYPA